MDDGKGNGDMTSRAARDDASVLKEIGRRIREGMAARAAAAPADGAPSVDTTSTEVPNPDGALVIERNARAAHEIRTPLSAIATAAEVMRDERFGPLGSDRYREYASDIADNAYHALSVVERMMQAKRREGQKEAPKSTRSPAPSMDLNAVAAGVLETLMPLARRQGIEIRGEWTSAPLMVSAEVTRLRQILLNAVTNALKFTPRGGLVVVSTGASQTGDAWVDVHDTGPGMTRAELAAALAGSGPAAARVRVGGGLGLGMSLMRELAGEIGARLHVDSTLGEGTTVSLDLPCALLTH